MVASTSLVEGLDEEQQHVQGSEFAVEGGQRVAVTRRARFGGS